jgi:hypothetical protein
MTQLALIFFITTIDFAIWPKIKKEHESREVSLVNSFWVVVGSIFIVASCIVLTILIADLLLSHVIIH